MDNGTAKNESAENLWADESGLWRDLVESSSPQVFCQAWLSLLCHQMKTVKTAAVLMGAETGNSYAPAAVWPESQGDLSHLSDVAEQMLRERRGIIHPSKAPDHAPSYTYIAYPLEVSGMLYGGVVLEVGFADDDALQVLLQQLHWGMVWLYDLVRRAASTNATDQAERIGSVMEVMESALRHPKLQQSLFEVANEIAKRLGCIRVVIGVVHGRHVRVDVMSHAAWHERKSALVRLYAAAMEEVRERTSAVVYLPEDQAADRPFLPAHALLIKETGAGSTLDAALRHESECVGVILAEREQGQPEFTQQESEWLEMLATLLGPVVRLKQRSNRHFPKTLMDDIGALARRLFGPGYLTWKMAGMLTVAFFAVLMLVHVEYRVSAKTVIEGTVQRAAVVPFDGYIGKSYVRAGDLVHDGQTLFAMDDKDLQLERARRAGELEQSLQKYREALSLHDLSNLQVLRAQIKQARAQLDLVEEKLARAQVASPFDGLVISGDLSQLVGTPVEKGKKLFEVAPLNDYRVILEVDERDIRHVRKGQSGDLVMTGLIGERLKFKIKTITPMATSESQKNYFRVEAALEDKSRSLLPGMEGVGKIGTDRQPLWWVVTHTFNDWLRLNLWKWLP